MAYKAKSITGAQTRVRQLQKQLSELDKLALRYKRDRLLLAMLAADGPCFYNPMDAFRAKQIRDEVLRQERLLPNGEHLESEATK